MTTAADSIRRIGEALYGPRFASELARDLGVSDRTVRAWLSGRMRPRPGVWTDLLAIAVIRQDDLGDAIDELRRRIA